MVLIKGKFRLELKLAASLIAVLIMMLPIVLQAKPLTLEDDDGEKLVLETAAKRIVALGPNLVESLFEIGAGEAIVGVSEYSDYPEQAKSITQLGSHNTINFERLVSLAPDLVVVWRSGFGVDAVSKLRALGLTVYVSEPHTLDDVAKLLRHLGVLTGMDVNAEQAALRYQSELARLQSRYGQQSRVPVFYQVWHEPMQTLNGSHIVSSVIELCGGQNVFADLSEIAPRVSVESVIAMNPAVIITSGDDGERPAWLDNWQRWPMIQAVTTGHIYAVDADVLVRHAPRILLGAAKVCQLLEMAR